MKFASDTIYRLNIEMVTNFFARNLANNINKFVKRGILIMEKGKIYLHYDMDAFFASIEQRDNSELCGKPIAIGYGVVTTASYEARKYGVKSAMPTVQAKRLCPNLIVVNLRKGVYFEEGRRIQELIKKVLKKCEFTSVDEGYIDITEFIRNKNVKLSKREEILKIEKFIKRFKKYIFDNSRLTCSVGIGFSKISAKIASDIDKPNGYFIFKDRDHFLDYIYDKELGIIPGIGKKTREVLKLFNIAKVFQLYEIGKNELVRRFGESKGEYLYNSIRGLHISEINTDRKRQSYGHEITFHQAENDILALHSELKRQSKRLSDRLIEKNEFAKTVTVKIRYSNFVTHTRSKTLKSATNNGDTIYEAALENLKFFEKKGEVRLIGIQLSSILKSDVVQLSLFDDLR